MELHPITGAEWSRKKFYLFQHERTEEKLTVFVVDEKLLEKAKNCRRISKVGQIEVDAHYTAKNIANRLWYPLSKVTPDTPEQFLSSAPVFAPESNKINGIYLRINRDYLLDFNPSSENNRTSTIAGINLAINPTMLCWHNRDGKEIPRENIPEGFSLDTVIHTMELFSEGQMGRKHIAASYVPPQSAGYVHLKTTKQYFSGDVQTREFN